MTEEELYGKAWRAMARAEGHRKGLPKMPKKTGGPDMQAVAERRRRVAKLRNLGLGRKEIADVLGASLQVIKNDITLLNGRSV